MKKLYVIMILCLITVIGSSAQQTNNDAFLPIEVKYGEGVNTYSLQSNPRKIMIPGFIENENAANYVFSPSITTTTPLQDPYLLTLKIASIKESSLFTAFKDGSEPVYSLNIGGTSFSGTGSDMGNGLFCIIFFASKKDFGKLTETLANEHNITASISKNASNLKIHIGGPNQNDTQLAKAFASVLLLMQSQLNDYIKNDSSQPSSSASSSSSDNGEEETFNVVATQNLDKHIDYNNVRFGISPEQFLTKITDSSNDWNTASLIEGEGINKEDGSFVFKDSWFLSDVAVYGTCDKNRKVTKIETWIPVPEDFDIDANIEDVKDEYVNKFSLRNSDSFLKDVYVDGHKGYYIIPLIDSTKDISVNNIFGVIEVTFDPNEGELGSIYISFTDHTDSQNLVKYFE